MRRRTLWILGFYLAKICNCGVIGTNGATLAFRIACYLTGGKFGPSEEDEGVEQIGKPGYWLVRYT